MSFTENIAKEVVRAEAELALGNQREKARQALKPFPTRIEPFSRQTLDELKGWRPPADNEAYILFEKKYIERGSTAPDTIRYTLFVMRVENRPDVLERLRYNVMVKGMRIIHWDKFPKINDSDARKAQRAKMHFDPTRNKTAYDTLEESILLLSTESPSGMADKMALKDAEITDLKKKLAAKQEAAKEGK